jgi:hypothetical protein
MQCNFLKCKNKYEMKKYTKERGDIMYIQNIFHSNTGISQYRIEESNRSDAKVYILYGQNELYEDLYGVPGAMSDRKQIKVDGMGPGAIAKEGDLLFSTISGEATIVSAEHDGYVFTQNYARMEPMSRLVDRKYMAYLINENQSIKRQFKQNLQGSQVIRYSLKLLKEIALPELPSIEIQRVIGDIYFKQLLLRSLRQRVAENTYRLSIAMLQGVE